MSRLSSSFSSAISSLVGAQTSGHAASNQPATEALDKTLVEMLDTIVLMYFTAVHRQLSKVCNFGFDCECSQQCAII